MAFNLLLFVLILAAVAAFVLSPLRRKGEDHAREIDGTREECLREKRAALLLLRDLEFDYRTGKILESDYDASKAEAEGRAVEAMRQLDQIEARRQAGAGGQGESGGEREGTARQPGTAGNEQDASGMKQDAVH